jgi:hypothetical protein
MDPPAGEAGLILVLAGGISLHHWQRLLGWLPVVPESLHQGPLLPRLAIGCLALAVPSLLFLLGRPLLAARQQRLLLYALLPLLWALLLARHLPLGMAEAGRVLTVSLAPLGAAVPELPAWSADPHVIAFCQSVAVVLGLVWAALLVRRLWPAPRLQLAGLGLAVLLAAGGRWLVAAVAVAAPG